MCILIKHIFTVRQAGAIPDKNFYWGGGILNESIALFWHLINDPTTQFEPRP